MGSRCVQLEHVSSSSIFFYSYDKSFKSKIILIVSRTEKLSLGGVAENFFSTHSSSGHQT